MAQNLVQMAFDAYNGPVQAQILQQDLALKKEEVQMNQLALQNQMGLQQDMTQIWGPGGIGSAADAAQNPTDMAQSPKLMATAQALAIHGQPQAAMQMLSTASLMSYRQTEAAKIGQQVQWRKSEQVGSALGAANDQGSYDVALAEIRAAGIDPSSLGLTGDYNSDANKIPVLAQSAMTRAQQLQAQSREQVFSERVKQDQFHNSVAMQRLNQGAAHIGIAAQGLSLRQQEFAHKLKEDDLRDTRSQEGLDLRKEGLDVRIDTANKRSSAAASKEYAQASKPSAMDVQQAEGVFKSDARTVDIPEALQKSLARMASRSAKQQVAQQYGQNAPPGAYDAALADQMHKMEQRGDLKKAAGDNFTFNAPPLPPLPKNVPPPPKASVPKGIPAGSKMIGTTPTDHKPVWQDPQGRKWVE